MCAQVGSITKVSLVAALVFFAAGCRPSRPHAPAIGEAYVGPATLIIRSEIALQSATVATVKHGDRLEILQRRRRFLKVRTEAGAEGWADERQLLATGDMAYLKDLAQRAAKMPAQGQGTTYSELNVHTQPARQSPSFLQIKQKEKVDVLLHVVLPRTEIARTPLLPPPPRKPKTAPKKTAGKEPKYPPPPMPAPPPLPKDWLELSKTDLSDEAAPVEEEVDEKPAPTDEWSLIRTAGGQSGWVLTRRLVMAIPDDVAQYAEGRRIVSYFSLGKLQDGDEKKDIWLWTTITDGPHPYDFESLRVFIWSLRRHRYETAHIERNLKGYSPVLLKDVEFSTSAKSKGAAAKYPGFSVCIEKKDGQRYRREYVLLTNVVRFAGEYPCETVPSPVETLKTRVVQSTIPTSEPPPAESFTQRMKKRLVAIVHGKFGG
ncbi:conserved exported hypothetical protein [Candidatus Sulfopaludibacter sp. SbA4]|nr:conserved exported hypothetical protein [Candidatus Sulfopaludibacter sp. SbA4]